MSALYLPVFDPGGFLQRLFSTFPNGWPGKGLLLLRLVAGLFLIQHSVAGLMGAPQHESVMLQVIAAGEGILLLAGLWTPIVGALVALTELWTALTGSNQLQIAILLATMGIALAIIGPGARSVDAHLFGRKRLNI